MKAHHQAWLKAHSNRSQQWLQDRLKDGFDVHHLDGNHDNDDPYNLVLIEHRDHLMLHSGVRGMGRLSPGAKPKPYRKIYERPIGPDWRWKIIGIPKRNRVGPGGNRRWSVTYDSPSIGDGSPEESRRSL